MTESPTPVRDESLGSREGTATRGNGLIPETVAQALARWDAGEAVFTVEMGGLGPGYEMVIQRLAFELMRALDGKIKKGDTWDSLAPIVDPIVDRCNAEPWGQFSGAQVGAAKSLAGKVCINGYRKALSEVKDRLIQVSCQNLSGPHQTEADRLTRALAESYPDQPSSRHREVARRILADLEGGGS